MIKSKKLSSLVAASLILAGGSLLGVQTVSAEVTDQQFNEVVQGVNANTQKISQIETQVNASKDYSSDIATNKKDIAANKQAIADEATARDQAVAQERAERKGADAAQDKVIQQVNQNVADGFDTINKNIGTITDQLNKNDLAEQQARVAGDKAEAEARDAADKNLQKDIAQIQDTLKDANAFASADATKAAKEAAEKANTVANNITDRVNLISNNQNVTSESDLIKKDQSIGQNVTNVDAALHKEIAARIGADAAQDKVIQQVNQNVADGFDTINKNIGTITDQLNKNDLAEQQARADKDKEHDTAIAANKQAIADEATARDAADKAEAKARANKDTEHDTAIAANKKAIGDESAARQADISRLDNKIHDVSKEVDTVGALSMAMSGLHPLSYDEGDARFQLSAAVGTYDGTEALALGGFYHFNRDSMLSVGVATDLGADEHRMGANVGYTRRIGQGGHVSRPSEGTVSDIMKDIKNLEQKQAKLEQENEQLKQQLAALKK